MHLSIGTSLLLLLTIAPAFAQPAGFTPSHLVVSSVGGNRMLELDGDGVVAGELSDVAAAKPRGVAFGPDGKLYVAAGDSIFRFRPDGSLDTSFGASAGLTLPRGLAFGPNGHLFTTSQNRVLELTKDGDLVRTIGASDDLGVPVALCFGADDHLFVATAGDNVVVEYDAGFRKIGALDLPSLSVPMGLVYGPNGVLYVSSFFGSSILAVDSNGEESAIFNDPALLFPAGIAVGPNGNLFVAAFFGNTVVELTAAGDVVREIALPAEATYPEGVAFAPYRFSARVSGRLAEDGEKAHKLKEKVVVSFAPGSRTLMLALDDGDASDDLASVFGIDAMVFHGFEASQSSLAISRLVQGTSVGTLSSGTAHGSLHLAFGGKLQAFGPGSSFKPKEAKGTLQHASPAGIFRGSIVTLDVLD